MKYWFFLNPLKKALEDIQLSYNRAIRKNKHWFKRVVCVCVF